MRKLWSTFLLLSCMLLSMQGALAHEIGHLADSRPAHGRTDTRQDPAAHAAKPVCDTCLAFDQIAGAAPAALPALVLAETVDAWWAAAPVTGHDSRAPPASARAPPLTA